MSYPSSVFVKLQNYVMSGKGGKMFPDTLWSSKTEQFNSDSFLSLKFVNFDWDCMAISCIMDIVMISVTFLYALEVI